MSTRLRVDPLEKPWRWIALALLVHVAAFLLFPPQTWLVRDEVFYVEQAEAFAHGRTTAEAWDGSRGRYIQEVPSPYPPGTSLLMALQVRLFGALGAFLVPFLASIALVLATGVWLQREGHSPLFALLTLTYPPTLVLSRIAMSDVPSAALIAVALPRQMQAAVAAHVQRDDLVVTNLLATDKLLFGLHHEKAVALHRAPDLRELLAHADRVWLLLLERQESAQWRALSSAVEASVRARAAAVRLVPAIDRSYPDGQRLQLYRVLRE